MKNKIICLIRFYKLRQYALVGLVLLYISLESLEVIYLWPGNLVLNNIPAVKIQDSGRPNFTTMVCLSFSKDGQFNFCVAMVLTTYVSIFVKYLRHPYPGILDYSAYFPPKFLEVKSLNAATTTRKARF